MPIQEHTTLEKTYLVTDTEAIHFLGPQVTPALSTPGLVGWMELTSRENVAPLLGPGEDRVGVSVSIKHLAPTPVGMKVRVVSRLMEIQGRLYSFEVEAYDEVEKIGEATHTRGSVTVAKFASRINAKKAKAAGKSQATSPAQTAPTPG